MLSIDPDPGYADVMEQNLYGGILSGVGLDGVSWFYRNFLRWHGGEYGPYTHSHKRYTCVRFQPGRQAICCPTNLLRTELEFQNYLYTVSDDVLWIHHYAANTLETTSDETAVGITLGQETDYPWEGRIRIVFEKAPASFSVRLRIPAWAESATLQVNGVGEDAPTPGTYAEVPREWQDGDVVELSLPMQPRLMMAHPLVEECRNQVAVMRGPMLYCLESHDLPTGVPTHEVTAAAGCRADRALRCRPAGRRHRA